MTEPALEPLDDLVARLERERERADRAYNDALTALDRALQAPPRLPAPPVPLEDLNVPQLADAWNIAALATADHSIGGRIRAWLWRLMGLPLPIQSRFNAAVVDHAEQYAAAEREHRATLRQLLDAVRDGFEGRVNFEARLVRYLQTITAFVDTKDRSLGGPELRERLARAEQRLSVMRRELENRPAAEPLTRASSAPSPAAIDATTYLGFEDRFRGSRDEIRGRLDDYIPLFAGTSNVIDVGCGRGELLERLRASGVEARGIDSNAAMVDACRSRGLVAERADALGFLEAQPDASLGGLIAIQVVEHFEPAYLVRFLDSAYHKLKPGSPIVLETINAACWMAFFETYLRDLTHQRPLHPDTLKYLVEASGFQRVDLQFRQNVRDDDRLRRASDVAAGEPSLTAIAAVIDDHADKLNARLFSSMDYVVIGRR